MDGPARVHSRSNSVRDSFDEETGLEIDDGKQEEMKPQLSRSELSTWNLLHGQHPKVLSLTRLLDRIALTHSRLSVAKHAVLYVAFILLLMFCLLMQRTVSTFRD